MKSYVDLYHHSKKNLDGIIIKLDEYLNQLQEVKDKFPNDLELDEFINNQKEIIDKIKNDINKINKEVKNKAYKLDK